MATCGIKHLGLNGYSNILPRIKFGGGRQVSNPQSHTAATLNRCAEAIETSILSSPFSLQKSGEFATKLFISY